MFKDSDEILGTSIYTVGGDDRGALLEGVPIDEQIEELDNSKYSVKPSNNEEESGGDDGE